MKKVLEKIKTLLFSDPDMPVHKRRVVCIISYSKFAGKLPEKAFNTGLISAILIPLWNKYISKNVVLLDYDSVVDKFEFLPEYPLIDGGVYACSELFPNLYIPLERFNDYLIETKINVLHNMCAALGAKSCQTTQITINGQEIGINMKGDITPILSAQAHYKSNLGLTKFKQINDEFSKPIEIKRYNSIWLNSEPSWRDMQEIRLNEKNITKRYVEFSITKNMGISVEMAAKYKVIGGSLNLAIEELENVKMQIEVVFYPYPPNNGN